LIAKKYSKVMSGNIRGQFQISELIIIAGVSSLSKIEK
jgi:hypothetical protein